MEGRFGRTCGAQLLRAPACQPTGAGLRTRLAFWLSESSSLSDADSLFFVFFCPQQQDQSAAMPRMLTRRNEEEQETARPLATALPKTSTTTAMTTMTSSFHSRRATSTRTRKTRTRRAATSLTPFCTTGTVRWLVFSLVVPENYVQLSLTRLSNRTLTASATAL